MASFDYRLNPLYPIKECSSCGALYTTDYCCSEGSLLDKIICDLNKTPNLSQRPPQNCHKCGNPIDGQYCQGCALLRKKFKEDLFTYCIENGILQDSSEPSNDNTNVVNALQEPFVVKQDPGKNSSQSPPHHCCYGCGDPLEDIFCHQCTCEFYGKGAHYGYNCPPKVSIAPNPEPCNNQPLMSSHKLFQVLIQHAIPNMGIHSLMIPHLILFMILLSFSTHLCTNLCILVNFVETMLVMVTIVHLKFRLSIQNHVTIKTLISRKIFMIFNNNIFVLKIVRVLMKPTNLMEQLTSMCDMVGQYIQKKEEEKQIEDEQAAKARYWKIPVCYDDDDDEDYTIAITPKELDNSLSIEDEHLDTVSAIESDKFIKSSVENLVPNPSESEGEPECDVPACEDFTTFSNILFDSDYDFSSSDDQSFYDEDIPKEIYSNPLFDEEIFSMKIDPRINETDCDPKEETRLIKILVYDNSSPRPPEELISENSDAAIESFSPFPIPDEDSDTFMKEIDLSFTPDDPMPSGIKEDDYDSEMDILILEELLRNNSLSLLEK
nr:hypothetical protein [Tanacetum cinerariifolium]